jgi:hypothetical protein
MGFMNEYIDKRWSISDLERELQSLIAKYNKKRKSYLFVYVAATDKPIPATQLQQADFFLFRDMLSGMKDQPRVDVYIETLGGRGETAEEIVRYLHDHFEHVAFVISGEAKSAGTLMVLSGHEILMTETGSLGPIDAQIKIGRSVISAHDYMEWVEEKRKEAAAEGKLNPFDATMVAQITPGELGSVLHSLKFAEDLVVEWLVKYKYKDWSVTETRKIPVTEEMKKERAEEVAGLLTDHSRWRSHGRSLKIGDLEFWLKITRVDDDQELAELVYRIQTVCRLIFESSTAFKIFATEHNKMFRHAVETGQARIPLPRKENLLAVQKKVRCNQCGAIHKLYGMFAKDPKLELKLQQEGMTAFPPNSRLRCSCGFEIDLLGIKTQMEKDAGRKMIS